jgi:hypothetical protein
LSPGLAAKHGPTTAVNITIKIDCTNRFMWIFFPCIYYYSII